jgi:two-component system, NarL family, nitrate/nitrite response regulator NarL
MQPHGDSPDAGSPPITVVAVDDDPLYRYALGQAIATAPRLLLVGTCGDGRTALARVRASQPAVAVVDLGLPDVDGFELLDQLAANGPATRVLVLSGTASAEAAHRALGAGARGYLAKEVDPAALCQAIVETARGGTVLSPSIQRSIADSIRRERTSPLLTTREQAVLKLAADGLARDQIAGELHVSTSTVKAHLARAYHKLGVTDRAAAVAKAVRSGML